MRGKNIIRKMAEGRPPGLPLIGKTHHHNAFHNPYNHNQANKFICI